MKKAFIVSIDDTKEVKEAVIITEDKLSYVVPLDMLPNDIHEDDFIIIDNGVVTIDPNNDMILASMQCELNEKL